MPVVAYKYRGEKEHHLALAELITAARYRGTATRAGTSIGGVRVA